METAPEAEVHKLCSYDQREVISGLTPISILLPPPPPGSSVQMARVLLDKQAVGW